MTLPCGHYRTAAGSEMWISGQHGLRSIAQLRWEEEGACIYCQSCNYDMSGKLWWSCSECGGGSAELFPADDADREATP